MDCKRILRYSPLAVLLLVTLVIAQSSGARKRDLNNLYQVIYYGDSQVEVGKPFSISCIISIANAVEWHKDGEPIRKHSNIRHGKDEHSYIESEMGIAGNRDKIEASISVQRALPKHQGKYQCNALYKNYHQLYVYRNGTLLGHGGQQQQQQSGFGRSGSERVLHHELQVPPAVLDTTKSTLLGSGAIDHHHFTTAVALAPAPVALDREDEGEAGVALPPKPPTGHGPHHHRQQQATGGGGGAVDGGAHRHHTSVAAEKKQQQHSPPGKEDSKRFLSQKTMVMPGRVVDEVEEEEQEVESLLPLTHGEKTTSGTRGPATATASAVGKTKHTPTARLQPPPPLIEATPEEDEEGDGDDGDDGGDEEDEDEKNENIEVLVEPEIIIESKAVSLEDDNIERLIQNKSDINGIILVDSLEEERGFRAKSRILEDPATASNTALMALGPTLVPIGITDYSEGGQEIPNPILPITTITTTTTTAKPVTTTTKAVATTKATTTTTTSTMAAPTLLLEESSDNTAHYHHHHHREHHTTKTSGVATTATITTTTTTNPAADVLQPNYDQPSTSLKIFDIGKALTLGCNVTQEGNYELSWAKNGVNVSDIPDLKDRFKILPVERKFIISRALDTDAGQYTCSVHQLSVSKNFTVVANVVVKFESTEVGKTNIVEGEKLTLHCIAFGTDPKIVWQVGNTTYNASKDHIVLQEDERGVENAKLIIDSITLNDYADYTCEARNNATDITGKPARVMMTVRIRGKYAALYVFVGIIAEVVVLCAIILICEKRRNKTEIEESDTDQSPDQNKNGYHGEGEKAREITTNDKSSPVSRYLIENIKE